MQAKYEAIEAAEMHLHDSQELLNKSFDENFEWEPSMEEQMAEKGTEQEEVEDEVRREEEPFMAISLGSQRVLF